MRKWRLAGLGAVITAADATCGRWISGDADRLRVHHGDGGRAQAVAAPQRSVTTATFALVKGGDDPQDE